LSQRAPFDEISEGYEKIHSSIRGYFERLAENKGAWFVPLSGAVVEFLADSAKIWVPQWVAQQYKKSKQDSK